MLIIVWHRIVEGNYDNSVPDLMPLFALLNLPRPMRAPSL
jgi:hypothetical protein